MAGRCPCIHMNKTGKVAFRINLTARLENGKEFQTQFMSKHFMKTFIYRGDLPVSVKATQFEPY